MNNFPEQFDLYDMFENGDARKTSAVPKKNKFPDTIPGLNELREQITELQKTLNIFQAELNISRRVYEKQCSLLRDLLNKKTKHKRFLQKTFKFLKKGKNENENHF